MSAQETPHLTALKKQWQLQAKAKRKVRITGGKAEVYDAAPPALDLDAAVIADRIAQQQARKEAEAQAIAAATPGQLIAGHGVFIGTWTIKEANSLSRTFNVFAAPEDLPERMQYVDAVKHIAGLKNWHGHNGENYASDADIYKALGEGRYTGGWFIPPRELLSGMAADASFGTRQKVTQPDNLFDHRDKGALFNTFAQATATRHPWYWSSTNARLAGRHMCSMEMGRAFESYFHGESEHWKFNCRPVRLELKP